MTENEPNTDENDKIEGQAIDTAPETRGPYTSKDHDITVSTRQQSMTGGGVEIGATAWDQNGVGVGGVSIYLSESATKELIDELEAAVSDTVRESDGGSR